MGYRDWSPAFRQGIIDRMDAGESARQIAEDLDLSRSDVKNLYDDFQKKGRKSQINPEVVISPNYYFYKTEEIDISSSKWQNAFVNEDHYYIDFPECFDPRVIANFEMTRNIQLMRNPHKDNELYKRVFETNAIYWDQGPKIYKISRAYTPQIIDNTKLPDYSISVNEFGIVIRPIYYKKK